MGSRGGGSHPEVILHPIDAMALAAAEVEAQPAGGGAIYPQPRTPAPLEADGVTRCTWDGELGCWRASDGSVRLR